MEQKLNSLIRFALLRGARHLSHKTEGAFHNPLNPRSSAFQFLVFKLFLNRTLSILKNRNVNKRLSFPILPKSFQTLCSNGDVWKLSGLRFQHLQNQANQTWKGFQKKQKGKASIEASESRAAGSSLSAEIHIHLDIGGSAFSEGTCKKDLTRISRQRTRPRLSANGRNDDTRRICQSDGNQASRSGQSQSHVG